MTINSSVDVDVEVINLPPALDKPITSADSFRTLRKVLMILFPFSILSPAIVKSKSSSPSMSPKAIEALIISDKSKSLSS